MHRFYVESKLDSAKTLEITNKSLIHQWIKVLRCKPGDNIILFDGNFIDYQYSFNQITPKIVKLDLENKTNLNRHKEQKYLFWSLLKRDNNELILQKATEIGIDYFIPLVSERSIKKDFNIERAKKILIEASEQCGRGGIPQISSPIKLTEAINKYKSHVSIFFCNMGQTDSKVSKDNDLGVIIGPEGGWTDSELKLFNNNEISGISLGENVLRAETAAIIASAKLAQIC